MVKKKIKMWNNPFRSFEKHDFFIDINKTLTFSTENEENSIL